MAKMTTSLLALAVAALAVTALPVEPEPSLKHDTDVVRQARPRMFLVDLIRPPASTADPLLTNEVDTSAGGDLPRLVRLLVADRGGLPEEDPDEAELSRLRPPAADQQPSTADWGAPSSAAAPAPSEELLPPVAGQADEWAKHAAQPAQPRDDAVASASEGGASFVAEPSTELQPPPMSSAGVWELFEGLKMVAAGEAGEVTSESKQTERKADEVAEPAAELLPPAVDQPDSLTGLTAWTSRQDSAPAPAAVPALLAVPGVPEPATHLLPPAPDSYMPERPSSGEAVPDDFLTLGAAPPAVDARAEYVHAQQGEARDSYLPEAGELPHFGEGPVVDDFLTIGELPKEADVKVPAVSPAEEKKPEEDSKDDARDSYMPQEDASAAASQEDAKDSYTLSSQEQEPSSSPVQEEAEKAVSGQAEAEKAVDDAVHEHAADHDQDHEYVKVEEESGEAASSSSSEEHGDEVSTASPHRARLALGKLAESGERR